MQIATETAGRIAEISFVEGGTVKAGDILVKLDDALAQAEIADAKARYDLAEANNDRAKQLSRTGNVTERAIDEAAANFEIARAASSLQRVQLAKHIVTAPFAGRVGLRKVSPGAFVAVGTPIVNLEKIDVLKVDFKLPELFLPSVNVGQTVDVIVDALPGRTFTGEIYAIDPQVDVNGRALQLRARLPNADFVLRPGLFARSHRQGQADARGRAGSGERHRAARRRNVRVPDRERQGGRGQGQARRAQGRGGRNPGRADGRRARSSRRVSSTVAQRRRPSRSLMPAGPRRPRGGAAREPVRVLHSPAGLRDGAEPGPDPAWRRVRISRLTVREYPNVDEPVVSVSTSYPGASATIIESQITQVLEGSIAGIEGIDVLESTSRAEIEPHHRPLPLQRRSRRGGERRARPRQPRAPPPARTRSQEPTIAKVEADAQAIMYLVFTSDRMNAARDHGLCRPLRRRPAQEPHRRRRRARSTASGAMPCASGSTASGWPRSI